MGDIEFDIDVDEDGIAERLEESIQDGIENAGEDMGKAGIAVAKQKVQQEGAIWSSELLNSFDSWTEERDGTTYLVIENDAEHAGPQEHGVDPSAYADGGPPVQNLLPWVSSELSAWKVDPEWAEYVVGKYLGGLENFPSYTLQEVAKGFWLKRKIEDEGLDPVRFMATAKKFLENNGDTLTERSIEKSLRKHGFL